MLAYPPFNNRRQMPESEHALEWYWLRQSHYILENPAVAAAREIAEIGFVRRKLTALRASAYFLLGRSSEAHYIDEIGHGDDLTARQIVCVEITSGRENFAVWRLCAQLARVAREPLRRVNDEITAIERAPAPRFNRILADRDECRPGLGKCKPRTPKILTLNQRRAPSQGTDSCVARECRAS
jgi:hypothetical protein